MIRDLGSLTVRAHTKIADRVKTERPRRDSPLGRGTSYSIDLTLIVSELLVRNWFRNTLERVHEWLGRSLKWPEQRKRVLFSLMKSMLLEVCTLHDISMYSHFPSLLHLYNIYNTNLPYSPGARFDDGAGGDNEVQRTMLELINQLDGFDPRGNIKVTNMHGSNINIVDVII